MANLLKMAITETIRSLHRRGWSQRRIAEELGVNRETVARHLRLPEPGPKPAIAPSGVDSVDGAPKPAIAPSGSGTVPPTRGTGRLSGCEPWRELITAKADQGLSAQRVY